MSVSLSRRAFTGLLVAVSSSLLLSARPAWSQEAEITMDDLLNDPEAPVLGPADADVTIVAFLDYNCPFCKMSEPHLKELLNTDAKVRVIFKDWPILFESSVVGAQLALAAKYFDAYDVVHDALMAIPGSQVPREKMLDAVRSAGVDMIQLQASIDANGEAIMALIRRNGAQADALGLSGTPVFLIGPYLAASALDLAMFRDAVAQARAQNA